MNEKKAVEPAGWEGVCYLMFTELKSRLGKRKDKSFFEDIPCDDKLVFAYVALHAKIDQQLNDAEQLVDYVEIQYQDTEAPIRLDRCDYGELKLIYPDDHTLVMKTVQDSLRPEKFYTRLRIYLTRHSLEALLMKAEARVVTMVKKHLASNDPQYIKFQKECEEELGGDPQTVLHDFNVYCSRTVGFFGKYTELNESVSKNWQCFLKGRNPELTDSRLEYFIQAFRCVQKGIPGEIRKSDLKKYENLCKEWFPDVENSQIFLSILKNMLGGNEMPSRSNDVDLLRIGGYVPYKIKKPEAEFTENKLSQLLGGVEKICETINHMGIVSVKYGRYSSYPGEPDIIEHGPSFI